MSNSKEQLNNIIETLQKQQESYNLEDAKKGVGKDAKRGVKKSTHSQE